LKIVVIGGTRYIGKRLVELLDTRENQVNVLSRSFCYSKSGIIYHQVDRQEQDDLRRVLSEINPEIIIDMVCMVEGDSQIMVDLYDAGAMPALRHYVMISTFYLFLYEYNEINIDEYSLNKLKAERVIKKSKLYEVSSIVRLPFVFSADDYTGRFEFLVLMLRDGKIIKLNPKSDYQMYFIDKESASRNLKMIAEKGPIGIIAIAAGKCSYKRFCKMIASKIEVDVCFREEMENSNIYSVDNEIDMSGWLLSDEFSDFEKIVETESRKVLYEH